MMREGKALLDFHGLRRTRRSSHCLPMVSHPLLRRIVLHNGLLMESNIRTGGVTEVIDACQAPLCESAPRASTKLDGDCSIRCR